MSELITTGFERGVLTVMLHRPEKRNALSRALIAEVEAAFRLWSVRDDVVVALITGAGDKAFASGGDIYELNSIKTEKEALAFARETRAALDTIRRFPVPVVAVLNGDALGGGAELAMACDLRIATPHAKIGFLQGQLNIATAWGGGTDLFQLVGPSQALDLLCAATALAAPQALTIGLIDAVAPAGIEMAEFAAKYVARFTDRKPQVMRAFKSLAIVHRFGGDANEKAATESAQFAQTWVHDDHWIAANAIAERIR